MGITAILFGAFGLQNRTEKKILPDTKMKCCEHKMETGDIKNPELRKLVESAVKHASSTIVNDLKDALDESSIDDELLANWQSSLESLNKECQHYWGELENMNIRQTLG